MTSIGCVNETEISQGNFREPRIPHFDFNGLVSSAKVKFLKTTHVQYTCVLCTLQSQFLYVPSKALHLLNAKDNGFNYFFTSATFRLPFRLFLVRKSQSSSS